MFFDVISPKDNEVAMFKMAERLGYDGLYLLYPFSSDILEKVALFQKKTPLKLKPAFLCTENNLSKAQKTKAATFMKSSTPRNLWRRKPSVIFSLESSPKRDPIYSRRSGITQVDAKAAQENKVAIGFSIPRSQSLFPRYSQNIKLCRKYSVTTMIFSLAQSPYNMRAPRDIQSLFEVLGMTPGDARASLSRATFK